MLSCLSVVATGIAWWAHYTTLNTNGYMKIVGPIGKDPAAIKSLSDYMSTQVITATDLQARAESVLPERAQVPGRAPHRADRAVHPGADLQAAQHRTRRTRPGSRSTRSRTTRSSGCCAARTRYTYVAGSDVKLNVLPLVSQALVWLEGKLPGALQGRIAVPVIAADTPPEEAIQQVSTWSGKSLPADFGQITLLESDSLGAAQTAIRVFDAMMWVLPVIVAVLVALTIWLSHRRRTTIIVLGIGVVVALIITHVIVKRATEYIVDNLNAGTAKTVVGDVIRGSLGPLTTLTIWICVIGAVVAVVAWIIGRRDIQEFVVKAGKAGAGKADEVAKSDTPALRWMRKNVALLRVIGLVVLLILLLVSASSWTWIIVLLILLALYQVAVSYVSGEWPFQDRAPHETTE